MLQDEQTLIGDLADEDWNARYQEVSLIKPLFLTFLWAYASLFFPDAVLCLTRCPAYVQSVIKARKYWCAGQFGFSCFHGPILPLGEDGGHDNC